MITEFISVGLLILFGAMSPGPDFACVAKNTLLHSRRAGFFTTIGITVAIAIHMSYCILGLGIIITRSTLLFNIIKFSGAIYLIYLGINLLNLRKSPTLKFNQPETTKRDISAFKAFKQGFLCNLLNPKATLFFLALFTFIIHSNSHYWIKTAFAVEVIVITLMWFSLLTLLLSHSRIIRLLNKIEIYIMRTLGIFLIVFGVLLTLIKN